MTQREIRKKQREKNLKVTKLHLHSDKSNSFHLGLSPIESWELLSKISKEAWFLQTGQKPPNYVDKTIVKTISKANPCI